MQRRYDVYIEGKPLVIADAPPVSTLPPQWLALRMDTKEEIPLAVSTLTDTEDLLGIHLYPGLLPDVWKAFRSGYVRVKAAGGIVVDERGRLLVIRRLGRWDLPKGKVDKGESMDEAAVREVQEECGIDGIRLGPRLARTWHTYARNGRQHLKRTDWFLMRTSSEQALVPQHEEDIDEVRWVDHEEADVLKADTYPSLLPVVAAWEAVGRIG
jgi:8-oxo-dGTP pyrophosphatase MutT (NUDIX family)